MACCITVSTVFHTTNLFPLKQNQFSSPVQKILSRARASRREKPTSVSSSRPSKEHTEWSKKGKEKGQKQEQKKRGGDAEKRGDGRQNGTARTKTIVASPSTLLPPPPAGFVLNEEGHVLSVSPPGERIVTLVDPETSRPLECFIRRAFSSSRGTQCFLLSPLDTPLQILKIDEDGEGSTELDDEDMEEILPTAAYELAKRRLYLVVSGFCLTARGGFYFTKDDIINLDTEDDEDAGGSLSEGVEITSFRLKNKDYIIFTPLDCLIFVAFKDETTRQLKIAEDDLLEDKAVLDAIDKEREYQALMEEKDILSENPRKAT